MRLSRLLFVSCALCAALIACGGGGRGVPGVIPGGGSGQATSSRPAVTLRMLIPNATQITSARTKKPEYVSAAVASIVYAITTQSGTTSLVTGANYTNVTATPTPCTSGSNGLTCSISISASISASGTYNVTIATYDAAQTATCTPGGTGCAGNLLGLATLPETITVGSATPVAVTLGGIPAYLQGISLTGYAIGSGDNQVQNQITLFGPSPQTGVAEFLDADQNVIIPPGAPTVTASSSNTGALTVAIATPTPGQYALTWTPVKSGAYVQAGTYTVTLSLAVPNTSTVITYPLMITIAHSAVFAGVCGGGSNVQTVYGYLDGNTTGGSPDLTIWSNLYSYCNQAPGLATDRNGDLYVADGSTLWEYADAPGNNPAPIASAGSSQGLSVPQSVTVDGDGNVYVGDTTNGLVVFSTPGPSGFGNPVMTFNNGDFGEYPIGGVAADNAGNVYAAVQLDGDLGIYQLPSLQGGLTNGNTPNQIALLTPSQYNSGTAIAVDVQPSPSIPPNLWVGGQQSPSYDAALWSFSSAGSLLNTYPLASLGSVIEGVAVDGNGVVYAGYAGASADEIAQLAPSGYTPGAGMPIPSPTPYVVPSASALPIMSLAVAPAAGVRGTQGSGGGSPQPLSSPAATHRSTSTRRP